MNTTRASLLLRIRNAKDEKAWEEFHHLYAPLLYRYALARGLNHADAEDIQSTCMESIVRQIKSFEYDRSKGSFKGWLKTLVSRRVIDLLRKRREKVAESKDLKELADDDQALDEKWEAAWKQQHLKYCVEAAGRRVHSTTFEAFKLLVEDNYSVDDVCNRLSMNPNQVYKAKARVLKLVREEMNLIEVEA